MKKIVCIIVLFLFFVSFSIIVYAQDDAIGHVYDEVGVFSNSEVDRLNQKATKIAEQYECSIYIWIVDLIPREESKTIYDVEKYVDSFYEGNNLGYKEDKTGVILMLEIGDIPGERDYLFSVYGYAKTVFSKSIRESFADKIRPMFIEALEGSNYYNVTDSFIDLVEWDFSYFISSQNEENSPFYSDSNDTNTTEYSGSYPNRLPIYYMNDSEIIFRLCVVILVPFFIALIVCGVWKGKMKTAKIATEALNYIPDNGFSLINRQDVFLYRTKTTVRIESDTSSSDSSSSSSADHSSGGKV